MSDSADSPIPPVASAPKKTSPWIIVLLVVVLLCCLCFGIAGLIFGFWDPIKQALGMQLLLPALKLLP